MNESTDLDSLLALARAGDAAALGHLLERFQAYLTVLARVQIGRRLQGKADCADVVQEAFLDAARQFPNFRGTPEAESVAGLREIVPGALPPLPRRYLGTQARDVRL